MIDWSSSITINRPPEIVFDFLAHIHQVQQREGSPVLAIDLITAGPPRQGSRYREVIQMAPFIKGEIISEITAFEPPSVLEMTWRGSGMVGFDRYELEPTQNVTALKHKKCTSCIGFLRIMEPLMRSLLVSRLEQRLVAIKFLLEESVHT